MAMLISTIKGIITQELEKAELEVRNVKSDLCKSLEIIDPKLDAWLTLFEQKIESLGKGQQEYSLKKIDQLQAQVAESGKKEQGLEKAFELLERDHKLMGNVLMEIQYSTVENIGNSLRRNNLRLKGLKEGAEGENLQQYLKNLFIACLGSDYNTEVKLKSAYELRTVGRKRSKVMDREVLIAFQVPSAKAAILDAL